MTVHTGQSSLANASIQEIAKLPTVLSLNVIISLSWIGNGRKSNLLNFADFCDGNAPSWQFDTTTSPTNKIEGSAMVAGENLHMRSSKAPYIRSSP